tara:strand:- start:994 stop:1221 length:228 start_codon:yes stop_codon:yes gene_type:complete
MITAKLNVKYVNLIIIGEINMKEKDPQYVSSHRAYKKRIATRCRICGEQLLLPEEIKMERHAKCSLDSKSKIYMM